LTKNSTSKLIEEYHREVLSTPILFNIYLEEAIFSSGLLRKFSREGKLLAFADDMLLIADNENEVKKVN
jgi:hypothetical protein